jgi:hypothetical protein
MLCDGLEDQDTIGLPAGANVLDYSGRGRKDQHRSHRAAEILHNVGDYAEESFIWAAGIILNIDQQMTRPVAKVCGFATLFR